MAKARGILDTHVTEPPTPALLTARARHHLDDALELMPEVTTGANREDRTGPSRVSLETALRRVGQSQPISQVTSNRWVAA